VPPCITVSCNRWARCSTITAAEYPFIVCWPPSAGDDPTELNTVVFRLKLACTKNPHASSDEILPEKKYRNAVVTSKDLEWVPKASQAETFAASPIRPVHDDILIAKLRPGQEIEMELHCEKGIGRTHAKWSPVGTRRRLERRLSRRGPMNAHIAALPLLRVASGEQPQHRTGSCRRSPSSLAWRLWASRQSGLPSASRPA